MGQRSYVVDLFHIGAVSRGRARLCHASHAPIISALQALKPSIGITRPDFAYEGQFRVSLSPPKMPDAAYDAEAAFIFTFVYAALLAVALIVTRYYFWARND